jgi:hypothetical protein
MSHIQVVMDSRPASIHEQHYNNFFKWERYFQSLVYVLLGIGAPQAAGKVNRAYKGLLLARNETNCQVKRARLSAIFGTSST